MLLLVEANFTEPLSPKVIVCPFCALIVPEIKVIAVAPSIVVAVVSVFRFTVKVLPLTPSGSTLKVASVLEAMLVALLTRLL